MPPLATSTQPSAPNYYDNLEDLDACPSRGTVLEGILPYTPRSAAVEKVYKSKGKLLVCHDYKGGYTENPNAFSYTFNFWERCETFVYFSHHRVTVPPPGWINAAHRQGVKILGVLIFEHKESAADMLRLLVGKLPPSSLNSSANTSLPVSPHYARVLAALAAERGFDGYLLNFEFALTGGPEQARALDAWIGMLEVELRKRIGPHAHAIWYDSVVTTGQLAWQDRLNNYNLPFFLASTRFFTNYSWPPRFPALTNSYFQSLKSNLIQDTVSRVPKSTQDIFVGVDMWGRGSHGGGGFGSYKAIEHIAAVGAGMGTALFGQGWTWESEENEPGWDWERWWARERRLWVGPADPNEHVPVPDAPRRPNEPNCPHGPFKPMSKFYPPCPPPDPLLLPFWTSFCPGVGYSWFVAGMSVSKTNTVQHGNTNGWTDVSKQSSLGNQLWPRPALVWDSDTHSTDLPLPSATTTLLFDDAYNGGSSVRVGISLRPPPAERLEDAQFRSVRVPVQGLSVTPGVAYDAIVIYKVEGDAGDDRDAGVDVNVGLSVKTKTATGSTDLKNNASPDAHYDERLNGWSRTSIRFTPDPKGPAEGILVSIGVVLGMFVEDASKSYDISLRLGQLSVVPAPQEGVEPALPRILWAHCQRQGPRSAAGTPLSVSSSQTSLTTSVSSSRASLATPAPSSDSLLTITWEIASMFASPARLRQTNGDDPNPPWILDHSLSALPRFAYFNLYALPHEPGAVLKPEDAIFVGTSGWHGARNGAEADRGALPESLKQGGLRIYVQGVAEGGLVLPWERCAFVDIR